MTLDEIKKHTDEDISVEKLLIAGLDENTRFVLELINDPDLPVRITADKGQFIEIANRDIPQFVKALALMCNENYI